MLRHALQATRYLRAPTGRSRHSSGARQGPGNTRAVGRVGFIGLGTMGGPMALNVVRKSGTSVVVFDEDPYAPSLSALQDAGATIAASLRDFSTCDQIILCLPNGSIVESVLFAGRYPLGSIAPSTALVIDCSTTHPRTARLAAARLECDFIDAPVTGEAKRAQDGSLTIMVGGKEEGYRRSLPILSCMSKSIVFFGAHGNGQLAKALNNCLYNINCVAMGEALTLATKAGLDTQAFSHVVAGGTGQSFGFDKFSQLVGERNFASPEFGYPMGKAFKDMEVVADTFEELCGGSLSDSLLVMDATKNTYSEALRLGLADEHKGAMTKVYEARLNVTVRHPRDCTIPSSDD